MPEYDAIVLTDSRYLSPKKIDWYVRNVLDEDNMLMKALEKRGLKTGRMNWDNPDFDWSNTRYVIFRSTWDYFYRFSEFSDWLDKASNLTLMVNPHDIIRWNVDKHYLGDLMDRGVRIPPTLFIESRDERTLMEITESTGWNEIILKPAISGGGRHTYRFMKSDIPEYEAQYKELIEGESMLIQDFQPNVVEQGEIALMVFGGKYSHAVLKKAKAGDFRVQDDFGGSVHDHHTSPAEIEFAEKVVSVCDPIPVYARVDVIRDRNNELCVSELELIEPELWFRRHPIAAEFFADSFMNEIK